MDTTLLVLVLGSEVAAGFCACLVLFYSMKRDQGRWAERERRIRESSEATSQARIAALEARCRELEEVSQMYAPPRPSRSSLNLSTRSQALQMSRRGDSVEQIAMALTLPRGEVDLLLKVHGTVISNL